MRLFHKSYVCVLVLATHSGPKSALSQQSWSSEDCLRVGKTWYQGRIGFVVRS